jgi:hypothetical protein
MKKLILGFLIASVIFSSCKKSSTTTGGVGAATSQAYGELTVLRSYSYNSGFLSAPTNTGYANFRTNINNIASLIQISSVSANSVKLKYQSVSTSYLDTTNTLPIIPTTWKVAGASSIPSFTYTDNDSLPGYTGYVLLPDTIYRSQTSTLQINGISGADAIEVSFYNPTIPSLNIYQMKSTGVTTNNAFSFSPTALSPLPLSASSGPTLLIISVFKHNSQFISGVNFSFVTQLEINTQVYIK